MDRGHDRPLEGNRRRPPKLHGAVRSRSRIARSLDGGECDAREDPTQWTGLGLNGYRSAGSATVRPAAKYTAGKVARHDRPLAGFHPGS